MEVFVEMEIAARGWHVYGKTVWQSPRKGEKFGFSSHMVEKWRQMCCLFDRYHHQSQVED